MTFASWRRRSRSLKGRRGLENDKSSLAVDNICGGGGTSDCRVPQKPGPGPLLAVVERLAPVSGPVCVVNEPRQLSGIDAGCDDNGNSGSNSCDRPDHAAVSGHCVVCIVQASRC